MEITHPVDDVLIVDGTLPVESLQYSVAPVRSEGSDAYVEDDVIEVDPDDAALDVLSSVDEALVSSDDVDVD